MQLKREFRDHLRVRLNFTHLLVNEVKMFNISTLFPPCDISCPLINEV